MQYRNTRALAIGGVLAAGALSVALVMPAVRQLGSDDGLWLGMALFALPILLVLALTGMPFYGALRGLSVAVALTAVVSALTGLLAVFAVASAPSGSAAGLVLTIAVFAVPAAVLVGLGLLAMRVLNGPTAPADREPSPPLTPARSRIPHPVDGPRH